nr:protein NLP3-like [Tanacetum cinerariifolium]
MRGDSVGGDSGSMVFRDPHMIKDNIKAVLYGLRFREPRVLVQFWSPVIVQKRCSLMTLDQPFGLGALDEGLYEYRLEAEQRMFVIEEEHKEELGSPGRVYCQKLPEWSFGIQSLPVRQYVQDLAACYDIHGYINLPVFEPGSGCCVGVRELITSSNCIDYAFEVREVLRALKEENLRSSTLFEDHSFYTQVRDERRQHEQNEIKNKPSIAAEGTGQNVVPCLDVGIKDFDINLGTAQRNRKKSMSSISLEEIAKHIGKPIRVAAASLNVVVSRFVRRFRKSRGILRRPYRNGPDKRISRGILRWPYRNGPDKSDPLRQLDQTEIHTSEDASNKVFGERLGTKNDLATLTEHDKHNNDLNTTPPAKENNADVETNASMVDQQAFIVNSIKALQTLVNQSRGRTRGMRLTELDFEEDDLSHPVTGSEYVEDKYKDVAPTYRTKEEDLSKPFKEAQLKSPFSSRILMFSAPKNKMPPHIRMYDGSKDPEDHLSLFSGAAINSEWPMPVPHPLLTKEEVFQGSNRNPQDPKKGKQDPSSIQRTIHRGKQSHSEIMQIGAFMYGHKCPELSKKFADKIPRTVDEMMERVDDFLRSEEANDTTEAPRGEATDSQKRGEHQLNLSRPPPMIGVSQKENLDRFCEYHGEKGHYIDDCYQLKKQLETALESGKLNHLVREVKNRGKGNQKGKGKVINMVRSSGYRRKRMLEDNEESWMNVSITFPPVPRANAKESPIIIQAEIAGYSVQRIYVDNGADSEIMYEHCFRCLDPWTQNRLRPSHTKLVGFSGEVSRSIGKIELEVIVGEGTRSRRTIMEFEIVRAASPYNVLLGRPYLESCAFHCPWYVQIPDSRRSRDHHHSAVHDYRMSKSRKDVRVRCNIKDERRSFGKMQHDITRKWRSIHSPEIRTYNRRSKNDNLHAMP